MSETREAAELLLMSLRWYLRPPFGEPHRLDVTDTATALAAARAEGEAAGRARGLREAFNVLKRHRGVHIDTADDYWHAAKELEALAAAPAGVPPTEEPTR